MIESPTTDADQKDLHQRRPALLAVDDGPAVLAAVDRLEGVVPLMHKYLAIA